MVVIKVVFGVGSGFVISVIKFVIGYFLGVVGGIEVIFMVLVLCD